MSIDLMAGDPVARQQQGTHTQRGAQTETGPPFISRVAFCRADAEHGQINTCQNT